LTKQNNPIRNNAINTTQNTARIILLLISIIPHEKADVSSILSHTYPNVNNVPDNQLNKYLQLQGLHDSFWPGGIQLILGLLGVIARCAPFFSAYRTKLCICTDGLLKIYTGKDEAVRWDEVKELYILQGNQAGETRREQI
jgi:hypothetical protein